VLNHYLQEATVADIAATVIAAIAVVAVTSLDYREIQQRR
jgi:hypothetical protein